MLGCVAMNFALPCQTALVGEGWFSPVCAQAQSSVCDQDQDLVCYQGQGSVCDQDQGSVCVQGQGSVCGQNRYVPRVCTKSVPQSWWIVGQNQP
jgi:hypothetical protein